MKVCIPLKCRRVENSFVGTLFFTGSEENYFRCLKKRRFPYHFNLSPLLKCFEVMCSLLCRKHTLNQNRTPTSKVMPLNLSLFKSERVVLILGQQTVLLKIYLTLDWQTLYCQQCLWFLFLPKSRLAIKTKTTEVE